MRHGVARIPVSFSVTEKWLKKLAGYAKLKKDTSYKGLWTVSFTLKEMLRDGIMGESNRNLTLVGK